MNVPAEKRVLRREAEAVRQAYHEGAPEAGLRIARHFQTGVPVPPGAAVAGYMPTRFEADPLPLMEALRADGHPIGLPRIAAKDWPLQFHRWDAGRAPIEGSYRLLEPAPGWPVLVPDVLLVPLLAFDRFGYRLGYGGGYYDRTLKILRGHGPVLAVGIAFAGQARPELPHAPTDEPLDWIVTEEGAREFRPSAD